MAPVSVWHASASSGVGSGTTSACMPMCRALITSMVEWLVPPMLRAATKMVKAPLPMQDLNLVTSCMRLLQTLLAEFISSPQQIAEMNENVQTVSIVAGGMSILRHRCMSLRGNRTCNADSSCLLGTLQAAVCVAQAAGR